jgi:hypothetical protein
MSDKTQLGIRGVSVGLSLVSAFLLMTVTVSMGGTHEIVDGAVKAVDLAAQKDIVWLSLVVAITAMLAGAWDRYWMGKKLDHLTENLSNRPCIYREPKG